MMHVAIAVCLALAALVLLVVASRMLIADARGGVELSMGAESLFGNLWLFAGAVSGGALKLAGIGGWPMLLGLMVLFYLASLPARRFIKMLYLGADVTVDDRGTPGGFAAMDRKATKRKTDEKPT